MNRTARRAGIGESRALNREAERVSPRSEGLDRIVEVSEATSTQTSKLGAVVREQF